MPPLYCSNCNKELEKVLRCGRCKQEVYCSQECQRIHWKQGDHKKLCRDPNQDPLPSVGSLFGAATPPTPEDIAGHSALRSNAEERRRLGTSANDPSRINSQAETIAQNGKQVLDAGRYPEAIKLFTQAISLDPFNHTYFYSRSLAFYRAKNFDFAIINSQFVLELIQPGLDPFFCRAWCTMIQSMMGIQNYSKAQSYLAMALDIVDESDPYLWVLKEIQSDLQSLMSDPNSPVAINVLRDPGDDYFCIYTNGLINRSQPELLVVDISTEEGDTLPSKIVGHVLEDKMKEPLRLGDVFQTPWGHWVSAFPVTSTDHCKALHSSLMCQAQEDINVVVLKLDESEPPVYSQEQATAYIAEIVKNAPLSSNRYSQGLKLVVDSVLDAIEAQ
jgi:tetratricopeptide (TPR) repeat protein